jgi:hypothetical protein
MGPRGIMETLSLPVVILRDRNKEADDSFHGRGGEKKTDPAFRGRIWYLRTHQALNSCEKEMHAMVSREKYLSVGKRCLLQDCLLPFDGRSHEVFMA